MKEVPTKNESPILTPRIEKKIEPSFPKEPILTQEEEEFRKAIREKCKRVRRKPKSARRKANQLSPKSSKHLIQENQRLRMELRVMLHNFMG